MSRKFFPIFERKKEPMASKEVFVKRMINGVWAACLLLSGAIFLGAAVYHYAEGWSWLEASLNAIMIMTGLGLVDILHTDAAKFFTCFYAIVSAVVFYMVLAIIFTPLLHRFLHNFHLDMDREKN